MALPIIAVAIAKFLIRKSAVSAIFKKNDKPIKLGLSPIRVYAKLVVNAPNMSSTVNTAGAKKIRDIMRFARKKLIEFTPIAPTPEKGKKLQAGHPGFAKRGWKLVGKGMRTTVTNQVPYINLLDNGYSNQATNGIINPTLEAIRSKFT